MNESSDYGLNATHHKIIKDILSLYKNQIDSVALFGSRATGTFKENSDIDLVLFGTLSQTDLDRLVTQFDESLLPVHVDLKAYHLITHIPLKEHIDTVKKTLFVRQDL